MKAKCFHFGLQDLSEECLECESSQYLNVLEGTVSPLDTIVEKGGLLCKKCIQMNEATCYDFGLLSIPNCPEGFPVARKVINVGTLSPNFTSVCKNPLICFSCESLVYDQNTEMEIYP